MYNLALAFILVSFLLYVIWNYAVKETIYEWYRVSPALPTHEQVTEEEEKRRINARLRRRRKRRRARG